MYHQISELLFSLVDWGLEQIHVDACIFVVKGLNTWHNLFFKASHIDEGGMLKVYFVNHAYCFYPG